MSVSSDAPARLNENGHDPMIDKLRNQSREERRENDKPDEEPVPNIAEANGVEDASDEESSESDSSDEETIKAPLELLGEFLQYVRSGNWDDAQKLCKMILIYEPDNPEALKFQLLIEEKIQVERELAEESGSESSEEETSSEEEENEQLSQEEGEADESSESDDEVDTRDHMANKLIFLNGEKSTPVWRP